MKIYLDDERPAPEGWVLVKTVPAFIDLMRSARGRVEEVSLDHDLGEEGGGTGHDAVSWLEEQVLAYDYPAPRRVHVHTSNPSARPRMEAAAATIEAQARNRKSMVSCRRRDL